MATRFTVQRLNNQSFSEKNQDDESVVRELREKMKRLHFRLLDCQNQNQMLRKELLEAKKVINAEISSGSTENFKDKLNQAMTSDFRGRHQKITLLKNKLNELQNKIKELEEGNCDGSPEEPRKTSKLDIRTDKKTTYIKKVMDNELQYLLKNSCHLKRKLEIWKKRNAELKKEAELLRLEHDRLLEKSKEDQSIHESYSVVEKGLRSRQSEKLAMRSRLDMEKDRNEKLVEELQMLKEDLSMILSKINDDKMLIDAFSNQQGYLHDLLEHQKMIAENDNRRYRDDMREIQTKHAMNNSTVSHLQDIVNDRKLECRQLQQSMEHKKLIEEDENKQEPAKSDIMINESDKSQPDEESSVSTIESPSQSDAEEPREDEEEIAKLKEDCERYKNSFISWKEQLESLTRNVLCCNERLNEWMTQLLQTRSQYVKKNAEVRDLENTIKKLESALSSNNKQFALSPFSAQLVDEMEKKNDLLNEEYIFLISLKELLMSTKENTLEVFLTYADCLKKLFVDATDDLIALEQSNIIEAEPEVENITLNGGPTASL